MTLYLLFLGDISLLSASVGAAEHYRGNEISNVQYIEY